MAISEIRNKKAEVIRVNEELRKKVEEILSKAGIQESSVQLPIE